MKFLVIGHFSFDVIHPIDSPELQSYGGIYYSVATLATLLKENDKVIPVFGVNRNEYHGLIEHFKTEFPNVDTAGIYPFDEPTNTVHLFYKDSETRIECSKDISKPIPFSHIKNFLKVDGILINMISGSDITLETLDEIRMAVREKKIPIHFDFHSLTLGVQENHERFRRAVSDWRRWCFMIDTIQLNEEEMAGLPLEKMSEQQTIGHMLTLNVKGIIVTRGERGGTVFSSEHKKILRHDFDGLQPERPRDAAGCGDVFGAAFHLQHVRSNDIVEAAAFANRVAAKKASMIGVDTIKQLAEA
jgi:sugar/nucleoside kinase (ribokinase family)